MNFVWGVLVGAVIVLVVRAWLRSSQRTGAVAPAPSGPPTPKPAPAKQDLENPEMERAHALLRSDARFILITGRAGTGKSPLISEFRRSTREEVAVVAPTAVAALNVDGRTIHSFFGFKPEPIPVEHIPEVTDRELYTHLDTLVIDEVSMVRADLLGETCFNCRPWLPRLLCSDSLQIGIAASTSFEPACFGNFPWSSLNCASRTGNLIRHSWRFSMRFATARLLRQNWMY